MMMHGGAQGGGNGGMMHAGGMSPGCGGMSPGGGMVAGGMATGGGMHASAGTCCGVGELDACAVTTPSAGVMMYVGTGGCYTTETTYKYVGIGAGQYDIRAAQMQKNRMPMFIACGVLVILIVVVALVVCFMCPTTTTSKKPIPIGGPKDCLIWGDPHVMTFDGAYPNFYGQGEYWIVKTKEVSIQGRYLATPSTNGLAATHQIVIGGSFMLGNKLQVGPMENGQITCNDQPFLVSFPGQGMCGAEVYYNDMGIVVDNAMSKLDKHIVHMSDHTLGSHVEIFRWANHINVRITMTPREGETVDGSCGNFNQNPSDDTTEAILARMGGKIPLEQLLFNHVAEVPADVPQKTIAECEQSKRLSAVTTCKASAPGITGVLLDSCIFDVCFAGDQYAAQGGLMMKG